MKIASMFAAMFLLFGAGAPIASAQEMPPKPIAISQPAEQNTDSEKVFVTAESKILHLFQRLEVDCLYGIDPAKQFAKKAGCAVIYFGNEKNERDLPVWVLGFEPGSFRRADMPVVFVCALDRFERHVVSLGEAANGDVIQKTCRLNGQLKSDPYVYQEAIGLRRLQASKYDQAALTDFQNFLQYKKYLAKWWDRERKKFASRDSYTALYCGTVDREDSCPVNFFDRTQTPYSRTPWE